MAHTDSKSPGNDKLIAEMFKNTYDLISSSLLQLINYIFKDGNFPDDWKEGILIPV